MIDVEEVYKRFGEVDVLNGVSFHVDKGEMVAVVGASGAGKTTLLQIVGTLLDPTSGHVLIDGVDPMKMKEPEIAAFRNRHIGFVFQFHHLLPEFSAMENVMLPAMIGGVSRSESERRAKELVDMVGLTSRLNHFPAQLSGGEQQRIAIARAMMNTPKVILADEPTGNLDSQNRGDIQTLLRSVCREFSQTIITVTHDELLARQADRTIVLADGRVL